MIHLAQFALSWFGIGAAIIVAIAAPIVILYFQFPRAWVITIWMGCAAWIYSGIVYQEGYNVAKKEDASAADLEKARQMAVRVQAQDKATQRDIENEREIAALEDRVAAYIEALNAKSSIKSKSMFKLEPSDVKALRGLQR